MRRVLSAAAFGGLVLLALPAPAASACDRLDPRVTFARTRIAAGSEVRVSGWAEVEADLQQPDCFVPLPGIVRDPTPSPTPTIESAEPVPPLAPLPPVPLGAGRAGRAVMGGPRVVSAPVELLFVPWPEWPRGAPKPRVAATVPVRPRPVPGTKAGLWRYSFDGTVTVPRDVPPGEYFVETHQGDGLFFGTTQITVLPQLPDTGAPAAPLTGVALLAIVSGGFVLELGRRARTAAR